MLVFAVSLRVGKNFEFSNASQQEKIHRVDFEIFYMKKTLN